MSRLIDADALKICLQEHYGVIEQDCSISEKFADGAISGIDAAMFEVDAAPTIDAIPVEWLRDMMEENGRNAEPYFAFAYVLHEWQQTKRIEELQAESEMRDWKAEQEAET